MIASVQPSQDAASSSSLNHVGRHAGGRREYLAQRVERRV